MRWHSHPDVDGFLAATASLLDRAVVNQLPVGVARSVQMGTSRFDEVRCFTVTDAAGSLLGAVVQTPPWPALLSEMEPATAAFAARQLLAAHPEVRGVNGPEGAAQAFGEAAGATTGATGTRKVTSLGVWSLHAVSELPPAPAGTPRVATPAPATVARAGPGCGRCRARWWPSPTSRASSAGTAPWARCTPLRCIAATATPPREATFARLDWGGE